MAKAIVIGSGIAGIASALRLKKKGYQVDVFESNSYAGGKLHAFENQNFRFDFGPSLFTMPHLIEELFELHNVEISKYFSYHKKEVVCNYFWDDGITFSVPADENQFIDKASKAFNTSKESLNNYLKKNRKKYELTSDIFLSKSLHKWKTYLSKETLSSLLQVYKLDISNTLNEVNEQQFSDPKLVQLFNRYATYNGSSPYSTPGIMSMIPHLEMHYGTFFPKGGMHEISQSLYRLAQDLGIQFHFNESVTSIEYDGNRATGIKSSQNFYNSDVVVTNMDVFSTYQKLLPNVKQPKKILQQERSSSAIIFYWGIKKTFPELDLHNILFSSDYKEEFKKIFQQHSLSDDPTVYINITKKEKDDDAPEGCENWFVMINCPGNFGQEWDQMLLKARENVISKINGILDVNIEEHIVTEDILDPIGIENKTGSHQGSLYGTSSNSKFASFLRHPNFSGQFKNLYFCGGSVHPGGGIPLCLLSAKIATDQIQSV
ncbi:MAG: 1-hydroxycarotenoid 3,4-desaturase CrtD [Ekhidna sp.]